MKCLGCFIIRSCVMSNKNSAHVINNVDFLIGKFDRSTDKHTDRQTNRQTDRQTDRTEGLKLIHIQMIRGKWKDRQTDIQADGQQIQGNDFDSLTHDK